jgi:gluconate 2-dehydrogenase gamma chain
VLKRLGLAGGGAVALPELSRVLLFQREVIAAQQPPPAVPATALSAAELATLAAVCARIIPTDENGPGATEARASAYIDRSLAGWLAPSRQLYATGLELIGQTAQKRDGRPFVELPPSVQDAVLREIEETPFFAMVRTHTIQGTFCDPAYGGNANFVGWDLLGYPGLRLTVGADDQRMGARLKPMRRSAYDYAMFSAMGATNAH